MKEAYNTNMMKYFAINLNARYRLTFKYSRDDTYNFSKMFDFLQHKNSNINITLTSPFNININIYFLKRS